MKWTPANIDTVKTIVQKDLAQCDAEHIAAFKIYGVEPYVIPIVRFGKTESAVVVARRGSKVLYWDDVEEGFNVSPAGPDGRILDRSCDQDNLGLALSVWLDDRARSVEGDPAAGI